MKKLSFLLLISLPIISVAQTEVPISIFMKDANGRFFAMEHTVGMLLAIVFAHIVYAFAKKTMDDTAKFKKIFLFSLLSLVVMLASIPWPIREAIARPLFPGM